MERDRLLVAKLHTFPSEILYLLSAVLRSELRMMSDLTLYGNKMSTKRRNIEWSSREWSSRE